jgi:hypothetical protein
MALITVKPNEIDVAIAAAIARKARPVPEEVARAVTWGADEKLLLAHPGALGERCRRRLFDRDRPRAVGAAMDRLTEDAPPDAQFEGSPRRAQLPWN